MTALAATLETFDEVLAISESLRRMIAAAKRADHAANRDSRPAQPGKTIPFIGVPPWAAGYIDQNPTGKP